jgi:hypothetical protein
MLFFASTLFKSNCFIILFEPMSCNWRSPHRHYFTRCYGSNSYKKKNKLNEISKLNTKTLSEDTSDTKTLSDTFSKSLCFLTLIFFMIVFLK